MKRSSSVDIAEIGLPVMRLGDARLNLAFRLNLDFAQLATAPERMSVFRQVEQRTLGGLHFAFDSRRAMNRSPGLVDQAVDQVRPDAQRRTCAPASAS